MKLREAWETVGTPNFRRSFARRSVKSCHNVEDLRALAERRVPRPVFDYVAGGADQEVTLRANEQAFRQRQLRPRLMVDVSSAETATELFGVRAEMPLILAPTGYTRMMHPEGEIAVARAAAAAGLPYCLSTVASTSIEDVARVVDVRRWFQLYPWRDWRVSRDLMKRAWESGFEALLLAVDVPVPGNRLRDARHGLTIPPSLNGQSMRQILGKPGYWTRMLASSKLEFANLVGAVGAGNVTIESMAGAFSPALEWKQAEKVRESWPGRLLLKGPLSSGECGRAVEIGADGVYLSNHGGRQLDRMMTTPELIPAAREAVGDNRLVVVDSGILHGTDVAVALALGADTAAVGKAYLYGLMAGGESGVARALELIQAEFRRTLQLLGTPTVTSLRAAGEEIFASPRDT
jgi:L-lactate dehydrogenase (cytochrome)